jgi:hypothetical protein
MTKGEIIEKLKPYCNGYDLPMSLNVVLVAEILTEMGVTDYEKKPKKSAEALWHEYFGEIEAEEIRKQKEDEEKNMRD